ncbi:acyl carrier protein [Nocardia sp. NBC_01499]|uniref:acyl carrier protein n=1 Tax=Nocardia sp. NBC_01499 TaxID=2903597 RepID=UPI003866DE15
MTTTERAMTTAARICRLLDEKFGVPVLQFSEQITFEQLEVDSLTLVEFALALKKEFGITLNEAERDPSYSIIEMATLVDAKTAELR